ncbi:hypothetical protein L2E82_11206 [Cichorium intybus]|uniref:Uncharacterized protein n=1 Tax=Cichorium intybus TaxID=13427 RepID=A0ACB9GCF7_CICIN|nr:hypothetical protein L2E82_11206 [Cichorium intybus]
MLVFELLRHAGSQNYVESHLDSRRGFAVRFPWLFNIHHHLVSHCFCIASHILTSSLVILLHAEMTSLAKCLTLMLKSESSSSQQDSAINEAFSSDTISQDVDMVYDDTKVEEAKRDLEEKLAQIISETNKEEDKFQSEQLLYIQEKKEIDDLNHRISLMESVMATSKEFQELAIYPHYYFVSYS